MASASKLISYADVSVHNTSQDCWVVVNSKIYNVTNFLSEHPGGDEVLLQSAGKDASEEFEDAGHGSAARLMLDEFYVGEVDPWSQETKSSTASTGPVTATKAKPVESTISSRLLYFVVAFAIIILGMGVNFFSPST